MNARRVLTAFGVAAALATAVQAKPLDRLKLPAGFVIEEYASDVPNARQLARSPAGLVFAGSRDAGNVYALVDKDGDARAEEVVVIARDLELPTGIAYRDGALYVAEVSRILRFDNIDKTYRDQPTPVIVYDQLPNKTHHGWKYLGFGPDGKLYVPVGAPCNICLEKPPFAQLLRMKPDGSGLETVAKGIRNTVGFTWHPTTKELWFTDNGRDWLGDDSPSCELNRVSAPDQHFGFPFVHGANAKDPQFGEQMPMELKPVPPAAELGPHVAPLGLIFYQGDMFPAEYRGNLLIAEHGSWNRSEKIGYRIKRVVLDENATKVIKQEPFITGFLDGEFAWGRPADLLELPDGSVLIADDTADSVYRLTYRENAGK